MSPVEFKILTPASEEALVANVRHALSLGLPELRDFEYPWNEPLSIIANGPTAKTAPRTGKTIALNGALRLFTQSGEAPTYWAACDPMEVVASFLDDAPESTTYLVASKCHPKVFERLKDRKVIVWHVDDFCTWPMLHDRGCVQTASTITLCSFELMARMGFRSFHTYGWDGCYIDGKDHAVPQPMDGRQQITVECNGKFFPTTTSWALEAQDAVCVLGTFQWPVTIHGPSMIGEIVRFLVPGRKRMLAA